MEIKRQKLFAVSEWLNSYDPDLESRFDGMVGFMKKAKHETWFYITHHIPFHAWNKTHGIRKGIARRYERIERTVRGRNMIKQAGEVSEFIKHISEGKREKNSSGTLSK